MKTFTLEEAKQNLDYVLEHAKDGGTITIIADDEQAYQIVATVAPKKGPRKAGRLKGKVKMTDEFHEPLPEFESFSE